MNCIKNPILGEQQHQKESLKDRSDVIYWIDFGE